MHPDLAYLILRGARAYTFGPYQDGKVRPIRLIMPGSRRLLIQRPDLSWVRGIFEDVGGAGYTGEPPVWLDGQDVSLDLLFTVNHDLYAYLTQIT